MSGTCLQRVATVPWVVRWGLDDWSFNLPDDEEDGRTDDDGDATSDGSGLPGRMIVGQAMARWCASETGATAALASSVFNIGLDLASDVFADPDMEPCDLVEAIGVWSACVGGPVPIDLAAMVFQVTTDSVLAAVEDHYWLFAERVGGVSCIGHEGE